MIRATTGGVLRGYRKNLMDSFIRDNKARNTVLTQRTFNSYAEDPAAAAKAFRLRKSRMMVNSQHDVCQDTYSKFQSAFTCLDTISKLIDTENGDGAGCLKDTTLEMLNDPKGDARTQLSKVLDQLSQSIVQNLNQKYGDDFIFAGADGHNVPFEVKQVDGKDRLYYRGVPVDATEPEVLKDETGAVIKVDVNGAIDPNGPNYLSVGSELTEVPKLVEDQANQTLMVDADGNVTTNTTDTSYLLANTPTLTQAEYDAAQAAGELPADFTQYRDANGDPQYIRKSDIVSMTQDKYQDIQTNARTDAATGQPYVFTKDGKDYYLTKREDNVISKADYDQAKADVEKLKYLMGEKRFVDIGLGFQENENNKLIESSAFDESLNGLTFLGYGLDEDGDPKNIYSIVQELREIADSVPDGEMWSTETYEEFRGLVLKLETAADNYKTEYTNMDAGTLKLKNNLALLEENFYGLQEQYSEIEDVDMADAISSFLWAEYCYNAALKVGNSILSQSLMDYLQ